MIGLYIHIPFCEKKCGYCDFISYPNRQERMGDYIDAVIREAENYAGEKADSVFIGGGTPSFLPEGEMRRLVEGVTRSIGIAPGAEFTIEANPNSLTPQKAREYAALGANRLSLGLQAVQPELLERIGRIHTYADFLRALEAAQAAGFSNISADIMYALPGQTLAQAEETARTVAALPLSHISAYALKLEKGTPMYGMKQPDEELDRAMFHGIRAILEKAGFARYEISNFGKPGRECAHNLKYWTLKDYVGLGAAAHSCYRGARFSNEDRLDSYIEGITKKGTGQITYVKRSEYDRIFEKIMLETRLTRGMELAGLPQGRKFMDCVRRLELGGLLTRQEGRIVLTNRGLDLQDGVVLELVSSI